MPSFFFIWPILKARAEILQNISVTFWAMEFQEKILLRFIDLYSHGGESMQGGPLMVWCIHAIHNCYEAKGENWRDGKNIVHSAMKKFQQYFSNNSLLVSYFCTYFFIKKICWMTFWIKLLIWYFQNLMNWDKDIAMKHLI